VRIMPQPIAIIAGQASGPVRSGSAPLAPGAIQAAPALIEAATAADEAETAGETQDRESGSHQNYAMIITTPATPEPPITEEKL
jgi:hypothetical protein